ncbi:MAG: hypothetical protein KZQ94_05855 [Candidatus Thiodiazotropha sp. (ex Troendleina suluensis)]|nr:hypothetical protein [Candidatus Thiodiazotropha sp. (ex Troendleina suluensis)]
MILLSVLAIAAASQRVGYVYLIKGDLKDWRVSEKAAKSPGDAAYEMQKWINELTPEVVVTEKIENAIKKGEMTKAVIAAMARVAEQNYVLDVSVQRTQKHQSKYEEAMELAERYPDIAAWLPKKRRFFDSEPRNTVLFEALALAEAVDRGRDS